MPPFPCDDGDDGYGSSLWNVPGWSGPVFDESTVPTMTPAWTVARTGNTRSVTGRASPHREDGGDSTYSLEDVPWYDGGTHVYVHGDEVYAIVQEDPLRWTVIRTRLLT